ncbi:hypothetical protein Aperf_G00000038664 [Anoplocephala perfoliata]
MSLDLISDASYLSREADECGNTTKQVRFDLLPRSTKPSGDSLPRDTLELSIEDETASQDAFPNPQQPCPTPVSESLDLSVLDESHLSREIEALSLDIPQINTVRSLQEEVIKLAGRVHRAKNSSVPDREIMELVRQTHQREAALLGDDGYNVCVNFTRDDRIFTDLLPLDDIDDEEVVRVERDRLERQRRRLIAENARLHPPRPEILPEPNPLRFFDPQQHIFQSARLNISVPVSRQPTLRSLNTADQLAAVRLDYRLCTEPAYYF